MQSNTLDAAPQSTEDVIVSLPEIQTDVKLEKVSLSPRVVSNELEEHGSKGEDFEPGYLLKFLLCAVAALEGADNLLMPATMFALQNSAGIAFTDLVYLGGVQAVCANVAAPLWGMLADNGTISRRNILIIGSLGQGVVTVVLAFVTALQPMVFLRGLNGIMLASLRPISNGVVADSTSDSLRGKLFGQIQSALVLGMLFTSLVATPIANKDINGIQGWRVAFVLVGSLSLIVCVLLKLFFEDPVATVKKESRGVGAVLDEIKSLLGFFRIPTFSVMIVQGIFGTIPWAVLGYMTLYFQLAGLNDNEATFLQTEQLVVGIFGNMLGGIVADALARRFGYHGRPLNAQFTVAVGLPLIYIMFVAIAPGKGDAWIYALLLCAWALLGCWAQSGTNFPILCEIVPADARCRILAWECCLENTIANAVAPFVVALVSETLGYSFGQDSNDEESKLQSAEALGKAMAIIVICPGVVCFIAYSLLHWSYPRDVQRLRMTSEASSSK